MSQAKQRFLYHAQQAESLLAEGNRKREKASFVYQQGLRNLLFPLEGLARLYREMKGFRAMDDWYKEFKALEDTLGSLDYYDALIGEFSNYKILKKVVEKELVSKRQEEFGFLEDALKNNGWLNGAKWKAFYECLDTLPWMDDHEDALAFADGMENELAKLEEKYHHGEINPWMLEEGVHEFRRRLRWIGIYSLASKGLVQLRSTKFIEQSLSAYCTKAVISSPFNKMPKPPKQSETLQITSAYFYAASWLISYLGDLKDIGQRYHVFLNLAEQAGGVDKKWHDQFLATCSISPLEVEARAETAIDQFIHGDLILYKLRRELHRTQYQA